LYRTGRVRFLPRSGFVQPCSQLCTLGRLAMWFLALLFEHPLVVAALLVALPSLLPSRAWFAAYAVVLGTVFASVWGIEIYQTSRSDYQDHAAGAAFGHAIFLLLTVSLLAGLIVRMFLYLMIELYRRKRASPSTAD
jgi:hypothetical protein